MRDSGRSGRHPTVLIASNQEWSSRSLESILAPSGFLILKAYTGAQALERARNEQPDAIILDTALPDQDWLDVCRQLRRDPHITTSTPILIASPEHATRQEYMDALRAGSWDYLGQPLNAEQLLIKLETFTRAKIDADQAREEGLLDQGTGLYNMRGLARRARELGSQASRLHAALACVVFAADSRRGEREADTAEAAMIAAVELLATTFQGAGRVSDAIGRLGPTEFAVVAFATDAAGSVKLAQRLAGIADGLADARRDSGLVFYLRAGYYAVPDFHAAAVDGTEAILRATAALRLSTSDPSGSWLRAFPNEPGGRPPPP